ncbi:MAG: hypothetical protein IT317_04585 [Anaerolineales bacterium]|nr:hypothetical protein [Anaerolineales bacterium]
MQPRGPVAAVVAVVALAVVAGVVLARPAPPVALDVEQPRLDVAAPLPGGAELTQTFTARHNGLSVVEVLAVVYPAEAAAPPEAVTLEVRDAAGIVLAAQTFTGLAHNTSLALAFAPQPRSAGQTYTLALRGAAGERATLWAYSLDGYAGGALALGGVPQTGDLRFTTRYTLLTTDWLAACAAGLGGLAQAALPLALVLFAPGWLLLRLLPGGPWPNLPARWGAALGLSLALAALLWLWAGAAGRWVALSPLVLWLIYGAFGLALAARWLLDWRTGRWRPAGPSAHTLALLAVLALGLAARLLAVRDLLLPQWVDGPHHYTIARVLAEAGRVPAGYAPLLPIARLSYHFGFHALAVTVSWLAGRPLADTILWLGQILQSLVPLAAYTAAAGLTGRARAGWFAAAVVALVSYFPGYYLTWGRYTQLAGLLLLLPALPWAARAAEAWAAGGRARWGAAALLGALAAGLLLTHYALFVLWVGWVLVAAVFTGRRALAPLASAGLAGALLAAPWLLRLGLALAASPTGVSLAAPAGYNMFPMEYFSSALERGWLGLAAAALLWGLARRTRPIWLVGLWAALVGLVVNLGRGNWLVTNNTLAITLFVPAALALGWAADQWLEQARRWLGGRALQPVAGVLLVGALGLGLSYGATHGLTTQANVVNPATVLVRPEDMPALAWADAHLPASAVVLVNSWEWLNGTWAGSDAGAWVWPLLGRRTTTPPADYAYGDAAWRAEVAAFNRQLREVADAEAPATLALLRQAGVTHLFIGARGGSLTPEMFLNQPHYQLLFSNGAAWVFAFTAN